MPKTDDASPVLDHPVAAVAAPAKINLTLHVVGRRLDGYHELESLAVFTRFCDSVVVSDAREDSFRVNGPYAADVPTDSRNLVLKARDLLRQTGHAAHRPVSIALAKNLPVASGVGGGSSDAAAALKALVGHWALDIPPSQLVSMSAGLGADVPMCLAAKPLVARGVGEMIVPLGRFPELPLVLVNPGVPVSTADVFQALVSRSNPAMPPLPERIDFDRLLDWLGATRNDLQAPATAIAPVIGEAIEALRAGRAEFARMSGSGATCFGLFRTANDAEAAARSIRKQRPGWFVTATESIGTDV